MNIDQSQHNFIIKNKRIPADALILSAYASGEYSTLRDNAGAAYQVPSGKKLRIIAAHVSKHSGTAVSLTFGKSTAVATEAAAPPAGWANLGFSYDFLIDSGEAEKDLICDKYISANDYPTLLVAGAAAFHVFCILEDA